MLEARRLNIILIDKKERKGIIIDIAVLADLGVEEKERRKIKRELGRFWKLKTVEVLPIVIGALGSATK